MCNKNYRQPNAGLKEECKMSKLSIVNRDVIVKDDLIENIKDILGKAEYPSYYNERVVKIREELKIAQESANKLDGVANN